MGRDFKKLAGGVIFPLRLAGELDTAVAGDEFHALGGFGAKMEVAGIDQADGFLAAIGKLHGVADDFAVKIDVGFGEDGDVWELLRNVGHAELLA